MPPEAPPRPEGRVPVRALVWGTVFAALVYGAILATTDVQRLANDLAHMGAWTMPLALALTSAGYVLRGLRWHLYLRRGDAPITPLTSILTFVSGFAMGITPGKLGEVGKTYFAREYGGAKYSASFAGVIAERVTDVAGVAILLGLGAAAIPGVGLTGAAVLLVLVVAGIALVRRERVVDRGLRFIARFRVLRRASEHLRSVHGSLTPLLSGRLLVEGVLISVVAWALEVAAMFVLARGLGLSLPATVCAFVFTAASIAGVLSMLPGGLGATEGGMVALLAFFEVPLASATALTIATRIATLWFSVAIGALAIAGLHALRGDPTRFRWTKPDEAWSRGLDGGLMAGLALLTLILRWPHRARFLNAWDSTAFALALDDYDVVAQRPHAPGYPVYVAFARLVHIVVPEANAALVWTSMLFTAVAVALLYGFGRQLGSRRAALGAAGLFMLAPIVAFNGVIALSYATEAAATTGVAWLAWLARKQATFRAALWLVVAWAVACGLRQSMLLFLLPLVAWGVWPLAQAPRRNAVALLRLTAAGALAVLAWFVPMVASTSGGWRGYRLASDIQGNVVVLRESVFVRGWDALQEHAWRVGFYLSSERAQVLPVLALVALAGLLVLGGKFWRAAFPRGTLAFLVTWLGPSLLFYLTIFSGWDKGPTGYILIVLPGLYLITALVIDGTAYAIEGRTGFPAAIRRVVGGLCIVALVWPAPGLVHDQRPWLEQEVEAHDVWAENWNALRTSYSPNDTAILTYYSWAHVKWYFPDYLVWGYFPIPRNADPPAWELFLETKDHKDDVPFYEAHARGPGQPQHPIPEGIRNVIVFDFQLAGENGGARRLRPEVDVTEDHVGAGVRLLVFHPDAAHPTIESYFRPLASSVIMRDP